MAGTIAHAYIASSVRPVRVGLVILLPYDNTIFVTQTRGPG
jgi:hypothetical protein